MFILKRISSPSCDRKSGWQKIACPVFILLLLCVLLSGCFAEFEANIYGTWISQNKIDLGGLREPEYEYIVFLKDGHQYHTNIFEHLYVTGSFVLFQEDGDYFFQLEHDKGNGTIFQYKFTDDTYSELKIKNSNDIVTVFLREKC